MVQVADFAKVALATTAERVIGSAIVGSIEMPKVPKMPKVKNRTCNPDFRHFTILGILGIFFLGIHELANARPPSRAQIKATSSGRGFFTYH